MAPQRRGRLLLLALGRGLPRLAGAVLGLALLRAENGPLSAVGMFVFFVSVPTNPARWWRYVRTGTRLPTQPAAEFTDPGVFVVELQDSGSRSIALIKALREVTTVELAGALSKVTNVPATIADGLSEESARRVRDRVERAGATASIVPRDGV